MYSKYKIYSIFKDIKNLTNDFLKLQLIYSVVPISIKVIQSYIDVCVCVCIHVLFFFNGHTHCIWKFSGPGIESEWEM